MNAIKKHASTAGIVATTAIAVRLLSPAPSPAPPLADPALPAGHPSTLGVAQLEHNGQDTRLVSCGNSRRAKVVGDDRAGEVVTGGANHCTIVFAAPWPAAPQCTITGGELVNALRTEIVVRGEHFKYRCAP